MSSVVNTIIGIIAAMNYGFTVVAYLVIIVYLFGTVSMLFTKRASIKL